MNEHYRSIALKCIHLIDMHKIVKEYLETEDVELRNGATEELRKFYRHKVTVDELWGTARQWNPERVAFSFAWDTISNSSDPLRIEWYLGKMEE